MTIISPSEYDLLKSLSGYEQQLEADKIGAKYGLSGAQIVAMISPNTNINTQYTAAQTLRFAYDPTEEAANRRTCTTRIPLALACEALVTTIGAGRFLEQDIPMPRSLPTAAACRTTPSICRGLTICFPALGLEQTRMEFAESSSLALKTLPAKSLAAWIVDETQN